MDLWYYKKSNYFFRCFEKSSCGFLVLQKIEMIFHCYKKLNHENNILHAIVMLCDSYVRITFIVRTLLLLLLCRSARVSRVVVQACSPYRTIFTYQVSFFVEYTTL